MIFFHKSVNIIFKHPVIAGMSSFYVADTEVSNNAKTYQLEHKLYNNFWHKISSQKLSSDNKGPYMKLFDDTIKSILPHLQPTKNDLHPEK